MSRRHFLFILFALLSPRAVAEGSIVFRHFDLTIDGTFADGSRGAGIALGEMIGVDLTLDTSLPGFIDSGSSQYQFAAGTVTNLVADIPGVLHADPIREPGLIFNSGKSFDLQRSGGSPNPARDGVHTDWLIGRVELFFFFLHPRALDLMSVDDGYFRDGVVVKLFLDYGAPSTDPASRSGDIIYIEATYNDNYPITAPSFTSTPEPSSLVPLILASLTTIAASKGIRTSGRAFRDRSS